MRRIESLDEIKNIELGILKELHRYCQESGLQYYLWGGTLLGAIRHRGFIPWDDDIDICMMRKDYELLVKNYKSDNFSVISCDNNKYYPQPYVKLCDGATLMIDNIRNGNKLKKGVCIDIFPIDELNEAELTENIISMRKRYVQCINRGIYTKSNNQIKTIIKTVISLMIKNPNGYSKKIEAMAKSLNKGGNCEKYILFSDTNILKPFIVNKEIFSSSVLADFEDGQFFIPSGYDKLLTLIYGDYMTPPPLDKQVIHHSYEVFKL